MIPQKLPPEWDVPVTRLICRRWVSPFYCAAGCDWRAYELSPGEWTEELISLEDLASEHPRLTFPTLDSKGPSFVIGFHDERPSADKAISKSLVMGWRDATRSRMMRSNESAGSASAVACIQSKHSESEIRQVPSWALTSSYHGLWSYPSLSASQSVISLCQLIFCVL
jgi:hypothetical protein